MVLRQRLIPAEDFNKCFDMKLCQNGVPCKDNENARSLYFNSPYKRIGICQLLQTSTKPRKLICFFIKRISLRLDHTQLSLTLLQNLHPVTYSFVFCLQRHLES